MIAYPLNGSAILAIADVRRVGNGQPGCPIQKSSFPGDFTHQAPAAGQVAETRENVRVNLVSKTAVFDFGMEFQERFVPGKKNMALGNRRRPMPQAVQFDLHAVAFEVGQNHLVSQSRRRLDRQPRRATAPPKWFKASIVPVPFDPVNERWLQCGFPTMMELSMPPDRKAPRGTSESRRSRTASVSRADNSSRASPSVMTPSVGVSVQ